MCLCLLWLVWYLLCALLWIVRAFCAMLIWGVVCVVWFAGDYVFVVVGCGFWVMGVVTGLVVCVGC